MAANTNSATTPAMEEDGDLVLISMPGQDKTEEESLPEWAQELIDIYKLRKPIVAGLVQAGFQVDDLDQLSDVDLQGLSFTVPDINRYRQCYSGPAVIMPTEPEYQYDVAELPVDRMALGAFSQMDIGGKRPPACTLYSALAAEFIVKNLPEVIDRFTNDDVDYFRTMQTGIYNEGVPIYYQAQANNLTSILDGRINPDELLGAMPERFANFIVINKRWVSANPGYGMAGPGGEVFECLTACANSEENTVRVSFIVADAETFVLVHSGEGDKCFYFNSHKTGLASESGGRATEFGVMDVASLQDFLTLGMHGNQPCNSIDFFYVDYPLD